MRRKQRSLCLSSVEYFLRNGFLHRNDLSTGRIVQYWNLLHAIDAILPHQREMLSQCLRLPVAVSDVRLRMRRHQHGRGQLRHLRQELRFG
jgi:hypothetical protein